MSYKVTIITYHYVRDLKNSRFNEIKGLDVSLFKEQVDYLLKHYNIITMEQLIDAIDHHKEFPAKSALLTFDDGYIDYFHSVFPVLDEKGIQGSFYTPVEVLREHTVLDVNKIHFILASTSDKKALVQDIFQQLDLYREEYQLEENEYYFNKLTLPKKRYDTLEVTFVKKILQVGIPEIVRKNIINMLFSRCVNVDEISFSKELYMNIDHIKCLQRHGMHIGSHGYAHYWLNSLSLEAQEKDIKLSIEFLKEIGVDSRYYTMCYPHGKYNKDTTDILKRNEFKVGLSVETDVADIDIHHPLELPRLDTNDIPKNSQETPNQWYEQA